MSLLGAAIKLLYTPGRWEAAKLDQWGTWGQGIPRGYRGGAAVPQPLPQPTSEHNHSTPLHPECHCFPFLRKQRLAAVAEWVSSPWRTSVAQWIWPCSAPSTIPVDLIPCSRPVGSHTSRGSGAEVTPGWQCPPEAGGYFPQMTSNPFAFPRAQLIVKSAGTKRSQLNSTPDFYDSLTIPVLFSLSQSSLCRSLQQGKHTSMEWLVGSILSSGSLSAGLNNHLLTQDHPTLLPTQLPPHFPHTIPFSSQLILFL